MIFESKEDFENEERILDALSSRLKCKYQRLSPKKYVIDAVLFRNNRVPAYMVEAKRRFCESGKYPTILLCTHKVDSGIRQGEIHRCPFLFVVEWNDRKMALKITRDTVNTFAIEVAGRSDRGVTPDIEPCYMIPIDGAWLEFQ